MLITERAGGLLLAEEAAAPKQIREALKRVDPELVLGVAVDPRYETAVWKVLLRVGYDRPAVWLFDWRDERGRPLPLTSRIVDEAAERRLDSRRPHPDPVAENDRMLERAAEEARETYTDDARAGLKRSRTSPALHRSQSLRLARARARARGESV